ncbi:ankyrin repeat domain-containing protein [Nonomuraea sp. ZG12]|uniref:ankyrin repeat domain-containing protein n=1 Tax=Nonomuraea sp. ZG12 TaxID=3452207 RepID=UPI003F88AC2D
MSSTPHAEGPISGPGAVQAIRSGDVPALRRLLASDPALATARVDGSRTLLHVATDWPGHFPNVAETIAALVDAGADVNAPFGGDQPEHQERGEHDEHGEHGEYGESDERGARGGHAETPLHWAASSDDVEALDALLDAGADIEARGAVIAGGTALADAVAFAQWEAARRLVARGAAVEPRHAAALGLLDQVTVSGQDEVDLAFWYACHGGRRQVAEHLLARGATVDWVPSWEPLTPLDAAERHGFTAVAAWLRSMGAHSYQDL